jgi:hypothetical protein
VYRLIAVYLCLFYLLVVVPANRLLPYMLLQLCRYVNHAKWTYSVKPVTSVAIHVFDYLRRVKAFNPVFSYFR